MDQIKIGRFIAALRKEKKMTQLNLAEKLGITDRAISKWENGRGLPDVSLMKHLCEILGITITELLNGERAQENVTPAQVEETVYEVLCDRETQIQNNNHIKKKYSALRIAVASIICLILASMIFSDLRGEGYSLISAIETQEARIVSSLIENKKYESAVKFIGFSHNDGENAEEKWVAGMEKLSKEFKIESIKIAPITLDDYFPKGTYTMTVYDPESQTEHIYEGFVTYQNGGIAFSDAEIPYGSTDVRRGIIEYTLDSVFATYDPG